MPGLYILIALLCVPPLLSARATLRRLRHLRQHGRPGAWPLCGLAFSLAALLFNLGVIGLGLVVSGPGAIELGRVHAWAAGLSWICLWIWIFVLIALRHRRPSAY